MWVAEPGCAQAGTAGDDCGTGDCEDAGVCAAIEAANVADPKMRIANASSLDFGARAALMFSIAENFSRRGSCADSLRFALSHLPYLRMEPVSTVVLCLIETGQASFPVSHASESANETPPYGTSTSAMMGSVK